MQNAKDIIQIENLSHEGKGVGRLERNSQGSGKACFVAGALPGETVRWKKTDSKRSFDEGVLVEVLEASRDRVNPRCEYIAQCGGCELQHLDAQAQLRAKEEQLKRTFEREGIAPESQAVWLPPLAGNPWEYRRRTRLAVAFAGERAIVGYRQRASRKVVPIETCVVLEPVLSRLLEPLANLVSGMKRAGLTQIELTAGEAGNSATNPEGQKKARKGVQKESQKSLEQVAICLSVKTQPDSEILAPLKDFCAAESIQLWLRQGKNEAQPLGDYPPLQAELTDELDMQFTPAQFVQTNAEMNRKMVAQAMELLDVQPDHNALDLFCGAGNFSLPIAMRAKSMLGIEGLANLITQADMNAARQQLANAEFRVADLSKEGVLSGKKFAKGSFDRVLLDPPRTGGKSLMPALVKLAAPKLVYISCHPATMVRDIKILAQGGYRLSKAGVIDMFPQTTHLEAIALLEIPQ